MKLPLSIMALLFAGQALAAGDGKGRPDVYTTRVVHVKADVSFEQAKKDFDALNAVLAKIKGFEKRNLFYDKEQKVWIDQIKWKHIDAAKSGEKTLVSDPAYTNLAKISDAKDSQFQAERVTEFDAPK